MIGQEEGNEGFVQHNGFEKLIYRNDAGHLLRFQLLKPLQNTAQQYFPLVLFLHGVYQRGDDNARQTEDISALFLNEQNRTDFPCYVLAPQCPLQSYWANTERKDGVRVMKISPSSPSLLSLELIHELLQIYPIDAQRLYITGLSMGSFGTYDLLMRHPDLFAAAIPICGGGVTQNARAIAHIPMWIFHGAKDTIVEVNFSRNMVKALQEKGGDPIYTEYPEVKHDSWINAYQEPGLLSWLFSQRKK